MQGVITHEDIIWGIFCAGSPVPKNIVAILLEPQDFLEFFRADVEEMRSRRMIRK